jgi:hypothetical protein
MKTKEALDRAEKAEKEVKSVGEERNKIQSVYFIYLLSFNVRQP